MYKHCNPTKCLFGTHFILIENINQPVIDQFTTKLKFGAMKKCRAHDKFHVWLTMIRVKSVHYDGTLLD